jgi:O-antigen biosynthesis protein
MDQTIKPSISQTLTTTRRYSASVIIVAWKQDRLLARCLDAVLAQNTDHFGVEVVVVSNGVDHSVLGVIRSYGEQVVHVRVRENLGFAAAANLGAKAASSQFLLFLNDDAFPSDGALRILYESGLRTPGVIGSQIATPSGQTLECGADVLIDSTCSPYFRGKDAQIVKLIGALPARMVTGGCFGVTRSIWESLGGYDEAFFPAYFEDADFCMRARNAGYLVRVQSDSLVYHDESASSGDSKTLYMNLGRRTFKEKWKGESNKSNEIGFTKADLLLSRGLPSNSHVVLHIDDFYPSRTLGSGLPRMWDIAQEAHVHGVLIFSIATYIEIFGDAVALSKLGHIPLPLTMQESIERFGHFFDSVLVSRPHNFEKVFRTVRGLLPNVKVTYDAESLFSERIKKRLPLVSGSERLFAEIEYRNLHSQEQFIGRTADCVVAISPPEFSWFEEFGRENVVLHRPWFRPVESDPRAESGPEAIFVAGWLGSNTPNSDALDYFVSSILPLVRAKVPEFVLRVTGERPAGFNTADGILFLGIVDDLAPEYERVACAINPMRFGSGVKLKSIEALANGCPLVTTSCGFEGLTDLPWLDSVILTDIPAEFAEAICRLVLSDSLGTSARDNARVMYRKHSVEESFWVKYFQVLKLPIRTPEPNIFPSRTLTAPKLPRQPSNDMALAITEAEHASRNRWISIQSNSGNLD